LIQARDFQENQMARIEGITIKNFKALKDISLGKTEDHWDQQSLTQLVAVIGKNGTGKSTLFDVFGFLADCLKEGVENACELRGRGGFDRIHSFNGEDSIEFDILYRESKNSKFINYSVEIDQDEQNRPFVFTECLSEYKSTERSSTLPGDTPLDIESGSFQLRLPHAA